MCVCVCVCACEENLCCSEKMVFFYSLQVVCRIIAKSSWYLFFFWFEVSKKAKLAILVEVGPKALFSIATTPRCRRGCFSISWIAPLYP